MVRGLRAVVSVLLALVLAYAMLWGALALWFKLPVSETLKYVVIAVFVLPGLFALVQVFSRRTWRGLAVFAVFFGVLLVWWQSLRPPAEADWAPDVARQVTGTIEGDLLTLDGVRAFDWRTHEDFTEDWQQRTYDLSKLSTVDLFLSYWGDPRMAHFILSFGFGADTYLAWSVEVRRLRSGVYSPVADFFKANALVILAAEEVDIIGLRTNVRREDVHLFPIRFDPAVARALLEGYVADANALAAEPAWYNSIFDNCTTVVFKTLEAVGAQVPFDWRLIVNGYLPELLVDRGVVAPGYTAEELRTLARVSERGQAHGLGPGFSAAIREGVPRP